MSVIIVPGEGQLKETARLLLEIADEPHEVRTVNAGNAFEVPDHVAEAYHERLAAPPKSKTRGRSARSTKE